MKKSIFSILTVVAITTLVFTSSCNRGNSNYKELVGKQWNLVQIMHNDSTGTISVPEGVHIIFADSGRVYGNAGCNNINGRYETTGHNQIGLERMASTMMWCMNMDFETAYIRMLEKVVSYEATADRLELEGTGSDFKLVYTSGGPANSDL